LVHSNVSSSISASVSGTWFEVYGGAEVISSSLSAGIRRLRCQHAGGDVQVHLGGKVAAMGHLKNYTQNFLLSSIMLSSFYQPAISGLK
jgi:hypothetical protein